MIKTYYIYVITDAYNIVLSIGVTYNLEQRIEEHRCGKVSGFDPTFNCSKLVYYEETNSADSAITREMQLRSWDYIQVVKLIESLNRAWLDLYEEEVEGFPIWLEDNSSFWKDMAENTP